MVLYRTIFWKNENLCLTCSKKKAQRVSVCGDKEQAQSAPRFSFGKASIPNLNPQETQ